MKKVLLPLALATSLSLGILPTGAESINGCDEAQLQEMKNTFYVNQTCSGYGTKILDIISGKRGSLSIPVDKIDEFQVCSGVIQELVKHSANKKECENPTDFVERDYESMGIQIEAMALSASFSGEYCRLMGGTTGEVSVIITPSSFSNINQAQCSTSTPSD